MTGTEVLLGLAVAAGYATWAYFHPFRACPRCQGNGSNRLSTKKRRGKCRRCKGDREVRTAGSRMLHRAVRSARGYSSNRKDN
jgi:DnaJ-class molecular chaperone